MKTVKRWRALSAATLLSLLLWSCDNPADPTQPRLDPSPLTVTSTSGTRFTVAKEKNPSAGSVSATIGSSGGLLTLGKHALWVPSDAVSAPTTFTLSRDVEAPLRVRLTAGRTAENDIGSAGFAKNVYLLLSYADAETLPSDEGVIEVIYFRPDGLVETMPAVVRASEDRVVAALSHFSMYGAAWP